MILTSPRRKTILPPTSGWSLTRLSRWLSLALLTLAPLASHAQTLTLQTLGHGTQPLDGPWQFHLGDDPTWSSPTLNDAAWEQLQTGQPWESQGHHGYTGFAWYRRHITLAPANPLTCN